MNTRNQMALPKFHETFNPILDILSDGQVRNHRDLLSSVVSKYYSNLPEELRNRTTKSGENLLLNRIAWGKSYLKKGGFIFYPKRGQVQITDKGIKQTGDLTLKEVESGSDFTDFYKDESEKTVELGRDVRSASPQDLIDQGFNEIENQIKGELLEKLKTLHPYYFEKVILILLKKMGYGDFIETTKSNDGGIDGIINQDQLGLDKIYIQAKRYGENKVREKDIRNFIGAMSGDTSKGVFVTTSQFDTGAIKKANDAHHKIILLDGIKLVDLMHQFNVGVQTKNIYEIKELDDDFFDGE